MVKRWIGPSLLLLVVLVIYTLLVGPFLADIRADWEFLHGSRMEAIRQYQQQKKP